MKCGKRLWMILMLSLLMATTVAAESGLPYETYTISSDYKELASPAAYLPDGVIDETVTGSGPLTAPSDMEAHDGLLYVLDAGTNRVLVLDQDYKKVREIIGYYLDDDFQTFHAPEGLTISPSGELYIADTGNSRIVRMTLEGQFIASYGAPEIDILGEYTYFPIKIAVDRTNRMYVIARGVNRGLVVLDEEGTFVTFTGAPRVTYDLFTLLWKTFLPRSASQYLTTFVPTEFSNLKMDDGRFIYTTIKSTKVETLYNAIEARDQETVKVVQRFNATGTDVLRRFGSVPIVGDVNWSMPSVTSSGVTTAADITEGPSTFEDIVFDETGTYYCIDSYRGKIFAYDADGNLLYAFGGRSNQQGTVQMASSIELFHGRLVVSDRTTGQLMVYKKTAYGAAIAEAANLFIAGKYQEAMDKWKEVARYNGNLSIAYVGIGKCAYRLGDYETAMKYLKLANEKEYYSKAYQASRAKVIDRYFPVIFFVVIALLVLLVLYALGVIKRKPRPPKHQPNQIVEGLKYALHLVVHPFAGFWELKHEKRGNAVSATILLLLTVLSYVFKQQYSGYLFSSYDPATYNVFTDILTVLLPVLLWVLSNWCLTTLMNGEGNMKDIYIATCYSLTPLILIFIPLTLVSNVMSLSEQSYYTFLLTLAFVWMVLLIFFGTMITHQYSLLKTLLTCLLILIGMLVIAFIAILFYNLLQRLVMFVLRSWRELSFRASG